MEQNTGTRREGVGARTRASGLLGGGLEVSYIANSEWLDHQRLELENKLIAAHVLATGAVPAAQFLG